MRAEIEKNGKQCTVRMTRLWDQPVEEVWSWLTENEKLQQWFPDLKIEGQHQGGKLLFDMRDGTFEEMDILAYQEPELLEYTWDKDRVRFELTRQAEGSQLVFTEIVQEVTDHTPRDLAGWHVCLNAIEALLEGRDMGSEEQEWEELYEEYKATLEGDAK